MKKLLSLVAVLVLVLTMAPIMPAKAVAEPVIYNLQGSWQKIGSEYYYVVTYQILNAPTTGTVMLLDEGDDTLAEAAIGGPLAISWDDAADAFDYLPHYLTVALEYGDGGWEESEDALTISFYNFTSNLADSYKSGDYVTLNATITLAAPGARVDQDLAPQPDIVFYNGADEVDRVPTASLVVASASTAWVVSGYTFRYTGPAGSGSVKLEVYAGAAYEKEITIEETTFNFDPATVQVITMPTFTAKVKVTDANGNPIPYQTPVTVTFNGHDYNATVDTDSYLTLTLPTPSATGAYTATVVSNTPLMSVGHVDGKGTFSVVYGAGLQLGALSGYQFGQWAPISIFASDAPATISKMWITVDDPNGVLNEWLLSSDAGLNDFWEPVTEVTYVPGTYCSEDEVPVASETSYYDLSEEELNLVYLGVNPAQGGTFTVTVKVQMSNGAVFTATKQYTVSGYRVVSITSVPEQPVHGATTTMTIVVTKTDGTPVNNAIIEILNYHGTTIASKDASQYPNYVNNGVYELTIPSTAFAGPYNVKIRDLTLGSQVYLMYAFNIGRKADLVITLDKTSVVAGGTINGTVTYADGNGVSNASVYVGTYSVTANSTGAFTIYTGDANFPAVAGSHTLTAYEPGPHSNHMGTATFEVRLPVTVTWPTDGYLNEYAPDKIVATTTEGLTPDNLSAVSSKVYVASETTITPADAVTFFTNSRATSGNQATISIAAATGYDCGRVILLYKAGDAYYEVARFALNDGLNFEILKEGDWFVGDRLSDLQVKITDFRGNPVVGVYVWLYHTQSVDPGFSPEKLTGSDGIAHFGAVYLNLAGLITAEANIHGKELTDSEEVKPVRPAPSVTVNPTEVQAGSDANVTLTLMDGAAPVAMGKSVVVSVGSFSYTGLVGADGVVSITIPAGMLVVGTMNGVVKVDGYQPAAFSLTVKEAAKPAVEIVMTVGLDIYTLNGQIKFWDAAPYIKNGRTMVPLRALAEALGFQVGWDGETKTVSIWKPGQDTSETPYIMLQIGTTTAKVGSALYELDVAAEIVNNRTMVPLRFVAERLGYTVYWTPPSSVRLVKP